MQAKQAEDETFIRWCFRERGPTNLSPKVRTETEYEIHYALANVLNTGKQLTAKKGRHRIEPPTQGTIKWYNSIKGYGFIVQQDLPIDIFMHKSSITEGLENASEGNPATYQLEKDASGRLVAIEVRITKKR